MVSETGASEAAHLSPIETPGEPDSSNSPDRNKVEISKDETEMCDINFNKTLFFPSVSFSEPEKKALF